MNKLSEGVVGKQIVKYFEENHGTVAVDAKSIGGTAFENYHSYDITFEDGSVSRWRLKFSGDMRFVIVGAEQENKGLADDDGALVSIQAKAIIRDGEVHAVEIFGLSFAHPETVRDIAQEAIDSTYGSVSHKRVAIFTHEDWQNMRRDEPKMITVPVHTY